MEDNTIVSFGDSPVAARVGMNPHAKKVETRMNAADAVGGFSRLFIF
jgi:hypothetical protein